VITSRHRCRDRRRGPMSRAAGRTAPRRPRRQGRARGRQPEVAGCVDRVHGPPAERRGRHRVGDRRRNRPAPERCCRGCGQLEHLAVSRTSSWDGVRPTVGTTAAEQRQHPSRPSAAPVSARSLPATPEQGGGRCGRTAHRPESPGPREECAAGVDDGDRSGPAVACRHCPILPVGSDSAGPTRRTPVEPRHEEYLRCRCGGAGPGWTVRCGATWGGQMSTGACQEGCRAAGAADDRGELIPGVAASCPSSYARDGAAASCCCRVISAFGAMGAALLGREATTLTGSPADCWGVMIGMAVGSMSMGRRHKKPKIDENGATTCGNWARWRRPGPGGPRPSSDRP